MRRQRGQVSAEYMGVLFIVATLVAALATGLPGKLASGTLRVVCQIAQQDCGPATASASSTQDTDHDGVPDSEDPVPNADDIDHDGLSDGEEIALGSDPRKADTDGDGVNDGDEYHNGTDPAHGVLPLTDENRFKPWERVGMTAEQWDEFQKAVLDEVNPGGVKGFLLGNPYYGVTLDENGELELLAYQENGIPVRGLLELLGAAGESASSGIAKALARLPAAARAALTTRGLVPGAIRAAKPPVPPSVGTAFNELDDLGRATGASATITEDILGTGTKASGSIKPPGYGGQAAGQAKGHLIARSLGGSGGDARNLVTLYQNPVNTPIMSGFERAVANAVRAGETVRYEVVPIYRGSELVPRAVTLRATGSGGFNLHVTILNAP
jgi:hypothetical protein